MQVSFSLSKYSNYPKYNSYPKTSQINFKSNYDMTPYGNNEITSGGENIEEQLELLKQQNALLIKIIQDMQAKAALVEEPEIDLDSAEDAKQCMIQIYKQMGVYKRKEQRNIIIDITECKTHAENPTVEQTKNAIKLLREQNIEILDVDKNNFLTIGDCSRFSVPTETANEIFRCVKAVEGNLKSASLTNSGALEIVTGTIDLRRIPLFKSKKTGAAIAPYTSQEANNSRLSMGITNPLPCVKTEHPSLEDKRRLLPYNDKGTSNLLLEAHDLSPAIVGSDEAKSENDLLPAERPNSSLAETKNNLLPAESSGCSQDTDKKPLPTEKVDSSQFGYFDDWKDKFDTLYEIEPVYMRGDNVSISLPNLRACGFLQASGDWSPDGTTTISDLPELQLLTIGGNFGGCEKITELPSLRVAGQLNIDKSSIYSIPLLLFADCINACATDLSDLQSIKILTGNIFCGAKNTRLQKAMKSRGIYGVMPLSTIDDRINMYKRYFLCPNWFNGRFDEVGVPHKVAKDMNLRTERVYEDMRGEIDKNKIMPFYAYIKNFID